MIGLGKPEIARLAACQLAARVAQLPLCAACAGFDAASGISFFRDASTIAKLGTLQDGLFETPTAPPKFG